MELSYTLRICFGFFFILVKEFVCKSDYSEGMCLDEYQDDIVANGDTGNVLYVCTNSPLSNETDTVYMDMAKVPRFENSACYCTVTFTSEGVSELNSVRLEYNIESSTDALTVNGYGFDRFSTKDNVHVVGTILKDNNITFKLTSPETDFKSCLRITSETTNPRTSLFRAECFPSFIPEINTSSTKTSTTQASITSGESTMETEFGSTSSLIKDTETESDNSSPSGAIIGGAAGGGVVLVIIIVIVIVVLVIKRKKTKTTKANDEDYYMTENDLYNVRNSSIKSANEKTYDTYDEIEAAKETRESRIYAEVNKKKEQAKC